MREMEECTFTPRITEPRRASAHNNSTFFERSREWEHAKIAEREVRDQQKNSPRLTQEFAEMNRIIRRD